MYAACMQYGCVVCAARMQHTCVTCAGVHVCSMYAVVYMPNMCSKVADICSMYAVYMPNMCSKVADIYAVCMHCMLHCAYMYSAHLMCVVACFNFCYAAHMKA